jgi:hypothetical protein
MAIKIGRMGRETASIQSKTQKSGKKTLQEQGGGYGSIHNLGPTGQDLSYLLLVTGLLLASATLVAAAVSVNAVTSPII